MFQIQNYVAKNYPNIDNFQKEFPEKNNIHTMTVKPLSPDNLKKSSTNSSNSIHTRNWWRRQNFANFFLAWFDFTHFLLILPFKVVRNQAGENEKAGE